MNAQKTSILAAIALAALALLFAVTGSGNAGEGAPQRPAAYVAVGVVTEQDSVEIKRYTGHVTSASSVDLVARISGELMNVGFNEGDMVSKNQVLYELDPVRYEAEVKNIEALFAQYEANLAYSELSFNRAGELYQQKAGTKDSMDSAEAQYKANKAALLSAHAQLITVKDDLKNTKILAPIDGKIGVTKFTEGNYLTPNSGIIATIIQLDPLRVHFSMANRDYLAMFGSEQGLKEGALLRLKLADDSIYEFEGKVEFIDNQANQRTDTVQIYAAFDNPKNKLLPGATVTVMLSRKSGGTTLAVTPSAVMHDAKTAYVYIVDDAYTVSRRDVVLGHGDAHFQAIKEGVNLGEMIVVDGMHKTMPGATIEPDFQGGSRLAAKGKPGLAS